MKYVNETVGKRNGKYPERVLQFGEGNFLRAFVDWMIDEANDAGVYAGSIVVCKPTASKSRVIDTLRKQDGIYTVVMRGIENRLPARRSKVITSISRCISIYDDYKEFLKIARSETLEVVVSNTTEAGIVYKELKRPVNVQLDARQAVPPDTFPAKVCILLYERFLAFGGDSSRGLLFLPVELIDHNGDELKRIVLRYASDWRLGADFISWVKDANRFANTLVDRIVTGYPGTRISEFEDRLRYRDELLVTSEIFNLWVIEGDRTWSDSFPIHRGSGNVIWTEDVTPYKQQKVRILNGGHTAIALAAYLSGYDYVNEVMEDGTYRDYLTGMVEHEVIPCIPFETEKLKAFAAAVYDRFRNPYIEHRLLDISLNSIAKFRARCLPAILDYASQYNCLPKRLCLALASMIRFYRVTETEDGFIGKREDGSVYQVVDDKEVLGFFANVWRSENADSMVEEVLSNELLWGRSIADIEDLRKTVVCYLKQMDETSVLETVRGVLT